MSMDAKTIVAQALKPAIATTPDDTIVACNAAARELLGLRPRERVRGQRFYELTQPADLYGNRLVAGHIPFLEMLRQGEAPRSFEILIRQADGSRQRIAVTVVVVLGSDLEASHFVYLFRAVRRRRRADEAIDRILRIPGVHGRIVDRAQPDELCTIELTPRQIQVLRLLAEGRSNEEMAEILGVSFHTVRSHVQSILERLEVHSKAEAVALAFREGVI